MLLLNKYFNNKFYGILKCLVVKESLVDEVRFVVVFGKEWN